MWRYPPRKGVGALRGLAAVVALLATTALPDVGWTAVSRESEKYFQEAQTFLKKGDAKSAIIQLKNALQSDPDNIEARFLLGQVYLNLGDGPAAEKELRLARQRGYSPDQVLVPLARAYLMQGKFEPLLADIKPDEAMSPALKADVLTLRGEASLGLGRVDDAEKAFGESLRLQPDNGRANLGLARVQLTRGQRQQAEASVDAALTQSPGLVEAILFKSELRRAERDLPGALELTNRAVATDPQSIAARLTRAGVLIDLGRDEEASQDIQQVRARLPQHPVALYLTAMIQARKKDYGAAQTTLESLGASLDRFPSAMFLLANVYAVQGRTQQAESLLKKVIDLAPASLSARKQLAEVLLRRNDAAGALNVLQPALKTAPNDAQLLALLGAASMLSGDVEQAESYYQKATSQAPGSEMAQTGLAFSHLAGGDIGLAAEGFEKAMAADPTAARPAILLAITQLRAKEFDKAIATTSELEKRLKDNPLPFNLRGASYLGKGDVAKARESFEKALAIQPEFFPAIRNLAQLDLRDGKPEAARQRYLALLGRNPKSVAAMLELADLATAEKKRDEAIQWAEKARDADPKAIAPRARLIDAYIAANRADKALTIAHELEQAAPGDPTALQAVARGHAAAKQPLQVVETYRRLVAVLPDSPQAHVGLALAYREAKDAAGERAALAKALEKDPNFLPAIAALVDLDLRSGRPDDALKTAAAFRDRQPNQAIAEAMVGDVLMRQKKYGEAIKAYEASLRKQDNGATAVRLYQARLAAGDGKGAIAGLGDWVKKNPKDFPARAALAAAFTETGQYDNAIALYRPLRAEQPDNPVILNNLAWALFQKKDPEARAVAERAYALAPQSPMIGDTLGWILVQTGDVAQGLKLLETAKQKVVEQPGYRESGQYGEVIYHYAVALAKSGQKDEARRYLQSLIDNQYGRFDSLAEAQGLLKQLSGG